MLISHSLRLQQSLPHLQLSPTHPWFIWQQCPICLSFLPFTSVVSPHLSLHLPFSIQQCPTPLIFLLLLILLLSFFVSLPGVAWKNYQQYYISRLSSCFNSSFFVWYVLFISIILRSLLSFPSRICFPARVFHFCSQHEMEC